MARIQQGPDEFAGAPYSIQSVYRFDIDGAEILVGDLKRTRHFLDAVTGDSSSNSQQRIFLAERPAGDPAAEFEVAWWSEGAFRGEQRSLHALRALLKAGVRRQLTFILDASYGDGSGEIYLVRVAPTEWREVASYSVGC